MNAQKRRDLLNRVKDTQERLEFVADGKNEIGNLCIAVSQLADAVFSLIGELPTNDTEANLVNVYCIHCGNPTYKKPRNEAHLEELLRYPVGVCPICDLKMSLMTDEEVRQHLAECDQEHKARWEEAKRLTND